MTFRSLLLSILIMVLIGCEGGGQFRSREKGALGGAAAGAGLGAIIGHGVGETGAGIAIGSGVGALAGALIGNEMDSREDRYNAQDRALNEQERQIEENRRIIDRLKSQGTDARLTKRGIVVNLPDVLFEFDSYQLTSASRGTVDQIADVLRDNSGRHVAVEGHTDALGTSEYNQRLSENRAREVSRALVQSGVHRGRVSTRGFGESRPLVSNSSASGRQRNRRVEVIIENPLP